MSLIFHVAQLISEVQAHYKATVYQISGRSYWLFYSDHHYRPSAIKVLLHPGEYNSSQLTEVGFPSNVKSIRSKLKLLQIYQTFQIECLWNVFLFWCNKGSQIDVLRWKQCIWESPDNQLKYSKDLVLNNHYNQNDNILMINRITTILSFASI